MHTNNSKQNGITLVALVISIIVMLMLAGVSLNATIGENGIVTQAAQAKLAQEEATRRENLEFLFFDFNTSEFVGETNGFSNYLGSLLNNGTFEELLYTNNVIVKYQGYYYEVAKQGKDYVVKNRLEDDLSGATSGGSGGSGGSGESGSSNKNYIVTPDNLTSGNVDIASGSSYIVLDKISGENFNFEIPAGDPVTIQLMGDMNIDNKGYKRSAIDLAPGATLNLYVYGTVEVNSGYGEDASGKTPGKGGYAGIHVPEGATLNLYGTGTITAIGGNAGNGEITNDRALHAGGGGAGAGIGGAGGEGGAPASGVSKSTKVCPSGKAGENCGVVNIYNTLTVYAYGGAGGSGGANAQDYGAGAGGYPAAGIGGGGAGGAGATCCAGAGGYTGGSGEGTVLFSHNGVAGYTSLTYQMDWQGGGYYIGQDAISGNNNYLNMKEELLGGMGGNSFSPGHSAGDGGIAGNGGTIKVSQNAQIFAYNGNRYTDGTDYENGLNQAPIYLQSGISIPRYTHTGTEHSKYPSDNRSNNFLFSQVKGQTTVETSSYQNTAYSSVPTEKRYITLNNYLKNVDMSKQGIGSGAGYIENSNGTYTIDATLN